MVELSKYQKEIENVYTTTNKNIVIKAVPGSGKTFTLLLLGQNTPFSKKSIFLAFNKSIAEELACKLPAHIKAMTLHSLGMRHILKYYGGSLKVTESKTFYLLRKKVNTTHLKNEKERNSYIGDLCNLYNLYRSNLIADISLLEGVAIGFDTSVNEQLLKGMGETLSIMNAYNNNLKSGDMIDFTDMLYLCKDMADKYFQKYDIVFIDECQDLSPLQKMIVDKIKHKTTRQISVGDEKQAIYAFTGADLSSFNSFEDQPNTISLPLSVTYRCCKKVTEEANKVFPGMESFETNPDGIVRRGSYKEISDGDFVLCRNNKPLVKLYIKLLVENKKSHIYGKDYGDQLLKILDSMDEGSPIFRIFEKLIERREKLIETLKTKGVINPNNHPFVVNFDEMVEIITMLVDYMDFRNIEQLKSRISRMFTSEIKGITLMTCHKSKGLENNRVFILDLDLIPNKYAQSQQMIYSEYCLKYVAITRAKMELIYINSSEFEVQ